MSNLTGFIGVIANGTSFNNTSSPVAGIGGTFGSFEILGIAAILIILIIGIKLRFSFDLIVVSTISMLAVITNATIGAVMLPEWIFWFFTIGGGIIFALGLIKVIKYR